MPSILLPTPTSTLTPFLWSKASWRTLPGRGFTKLVTYILLSSSIMLQPSRTQRSNPFWTIMLRALNKQLRRKLKNLILLIWTQRLWFLKATKLFQKGKLFATMSQTISTILMFTRRLTLTRSYMTLLKASRGPPGTPATAPPPCLH